MLNRDELPSEHGGADAPTGKAVRHLRSTRTRRTTASPSRRYCITT